MPASQIKFPAVYEAEPVITEQDIKSLIEKLRKDYADISISAFKNSDGKSVYFLNFRDKNKAKEMTEKIAMKPYYIRSKAFFGKPKTVQCIKQNYCLCLTAAEINRLSVLWQRQQIEAELSVNRYEIEKKFPGCFTIPRLSAKQQNYEVFFFHNKKSEADFRIFLQYCNVSFQYKKNDRGFYFFEIPLNEFEQTYAVLEEFNVNQAIKELAELKKQYQQKFPGLISVKNADNKTMELRFKDEKSAAAFRVFLQYYGYPYYQHSINQKNPLAFVVALDKLRAFDIKQAHIYDTDLHQQKDAIKHFLQAAELTEEIGEDNRISWRLKFLNPGVPCIPWIMKQLIPTLNFTEENNESIHLELSSRGFYEFYEQLRADASLFSDLVLLYQAYYDRFYATAGETLKLALSNWSQMQEYFKMDILLHSFGVHFLKNEEQISALTARFPVNANWHSTLRIQNNNLTENKNTIQFAFPVAVLPEHLDDLEQSAFIINAINANNKAVKILGDGEENPVGYAKVKLPWKPKKQYNLSEVISMEKNAEVLPSRPQQADNDKNSADSTKEYTKAAASPLIKKAFNALRQLSHALGCPPGFLNDGKSLHILDDQLLDMLRFVLDKPALDRKIDWEFFLEEKDLQTLSRLILYKSPQSGYTFLIDDQAVADYEKNKDDIQQQITLLEQAKIPAGCGIYIKQGEHNEFLIALKDKNLVLDQTKRIVTTETLNSVDDNAPIFITTENQETLEQIFLAGKKTPISNSEIIYWLNKLGVIPVIDGEGITIPDQQVWDMLVAAEIIVLDKNLSAKEKKIDWSGLSIQKIAMNAMKLKGFIELSIVNSQTLYGIVPAVKKTGDKADYCFPTSVINEKNSNLIALLNRLNPKQRVLLHEGGIILAKEDIHVFKHAGLLPSYTSLSHEKPYYRFAWNELNLNPILASEQLPELSQSERRQAQRQLEAMSDVLNRLTDKLADLNHEGIKNRFDAEKSNLLADLIVELNQAFAAARNKGTHNIDHYAREFFKLLSGSINGSIDEKKNNPLYRLRTTGFVFLFFSNFNPHIQKSGTVREIKAAIEAMEKVISAETAPKLLYTV